MNVEFGDLCDNPEPHVGHMRTLQNGEQILCEGRLTDARQPEVSEFGKRVLGVLNNASSVYEERNAVYKDNFRTVGRVMQALFPNGVPQIKTAHDFDRWHIFELLIVKLTRYVANYQEPDEDSLVDMLPYIGILGALDKESEAQSLVVRVRRNGAWVPLSEEESALLADLYGHHHPLPGELRDPDPLPHDLHEEKSRVRAEEALDELRDGFTD